jgi:(p)ppGpp synthase/HD superfamily hydrolase
MIYTLMTMKAMKLAYAAHQGQFDKSGIPYIFHPYHLAEQMEDELTCTVALLHDVVEDTSVTMEELEQEFPKEVTDALKLLTHGDDVEYYDYVRAIKNNPIAKAVKYADIMHNSDHTRLIGCDISEEKAKYWEVKYKKALEVLMGE